MRKNLKTVATFTLGGLWVGLFALNSLGAEPDPPLPVGKLYEVGGHKMHLHQTGMGRPVVILEAGAGAFSLDWFLVQQEVAKFTTVCSYDRAGHAWSELGPRPRTMKQAAYDLHRLLAQAGIPGPFILVGHSLGGMLVRVFAREYPEDLAGMVLVDAAFENSFGFINGKMVRVWDGAQPRQIPAVREQINPDERTLLEPELEGYKRFREWVGAPVIDEPFNKLPEPIQKLRLWAMSLPQSNVTDYNPFGSEESILLFADRLRMEHPLGNRPLVVLTRKSQAHPPEPGATPQDMKRMEEVRVEGEQNLRNLSSNALFVESAYPIHEIHLTQPELVVNAIRAVLESNKSGGKLKALGAASEP